MILRLHEMRGGGAGIRDIKWVLSRKRRDGEAQPVGSRDRVIRVPREWQPMGGHIFMINFKELARLFVG